jgi:hypothetical protein
MGQMNVVARKKQPLDERAVDRLVVAQANEEAAFAGARQEMGKSRT